MVARVATFQHTNALLQRSLKVQADLAQSQAQQASGLTSTTYSGLGRDTQRLLSFNTQISRLNTENAVAAQLAQTGEQIYSSIGDLVDYASMMLSQLSVSAGAGATTITSDTAALWRADLAAILNSQLGDSYILGGTATASAPVALDMFDAGAADTDTADFSYYQGASQSIAVAGANSALALHFNAGDPSVEKLIRATALLEANPDDSATIQVAHTLISEAIDALGVAQEAISGAVSSATRTQSRASAQIEALETLASEAKDADLASVAVRLSQQQTQLEAAYASLTALMKLNLLDFL